MTDTVKIFRDDAFWLLATVQADPDLGIDARRRVSLIEAGLDSQPVLEGRPASDPSGYEVFVVQEEYSDNRPIAVRTDLEKAFDIARIYNLGADGARTAAVYGYRFDGVGYGQEIVIPS
jgi:hypothetical protein